MIGVIAALPLSKKVALVGAPTVIAMATAAAYTSAEWMAIIAAVGAVLGVLVASIERIFAMKMKAVADQLAANTALTAAVAVETKKTAEAAAKNAEATAAVKASVDGTASRMEEQNKALRNEIRSLHESAAEKKVIADKLADAVTAVQIAGAAAPASTDAGPVVENLEEIKTHTGATAANTKRTEATVQELKDKS